MKKAPIDTYPAQQRQSDRVPRSDMAAAVERLKRATLDAARRRQHLPQPLFWSLFHSEVAALRRKKAQARTLALLLGDEKL